MTPAAHPPNKNWYREELKRERKKERKQRWKARVVPQTDNEMLPTNFINMALQAMNHPKWHKN